MHRSSLFFAPGIRNKEDWTQVIATVMTSDAKRNSLPNALPQRSFWTQETLLRNLASSEIRSS
jgi:hypothetical protein